MEDYADFRVIVCRVCERHNRRAFSFEGKIAILLSTYLLSMRILHFIEIKSLASMKIVSNYFVFKRNIMKRIKLPARSSKRGHKMICSVLRNSLKLDF